MNDITIILLTLNRVPKKWAKYHKKVLLNAIGDTPIITISKKKMDWGINLIQKTEGHANIYHQMLRGAKLAKTPYVAIAEDDTLYPKEHFANFRPPLDTVAYNMNEWGLFTWGTPTYSLRTSWANSSLIAPRELMVEALTERIKKGMPDEKCGEIGKKRIEQALGVTVRKGMSFYTVQPIVTFSHDNSLDDYSRRHRKALWHIRAYDIPVWGKAADLVKKFV